MTLGCGNFPSYYHARQSGQGSTWVPTKGPFTHRLTKCWLPSGFQGRCPTEWVLKHHLVHLTHPPQSVFRFAAAAERPLPMFSCQFNPRSDATHWLATANEDGRIILADTRTRNTSDSPYTHWLGHDNAVFDVQWNHDGNQILSASGDQLVKLWDVQQRRCIARFTGHQGTVKSVTCSPHHPAVFASGGRDGRVIVWDTRCSNGVGVLNEGTYQPADIISDAHSLLDLQRPGMGLIAVPASPRARRTYPRVQGTTTSTLSDTPFSSGSQANVTLSPRRSRSKPLINNGGSVTSVVYMAHREHCLASAGVVNGTIKYWDTRQLGRHIGRSQPIPMEQSDPPVDSRRRPRAISALTRSPDGAFLFAMSADHQIYMYNSYHLRQPVATFTAPSFRCASLYMKPATSHDSEFLAAGSSDHRIYIWAIASPSTPPLVLQSHTQEVGAVAWSRHRLETLASCSDDGTLRLWQVDDRYAPKVREQYGKKSQENPSGVQGKDTDIGYALTY
ncbi:hypothetical protein IWQ61_009340 [Dispira simplex]|nr:hypothetical protein IWQ61_009340 [Dispira simplex]